MKRTLALILALTLLLGALPAMAAEYLFDETVYIPTDEYTEIEVEDLKFDEIISIEPVKSGIAVVDYMDEFSDDESSRLFLDIMGEKTGTTDVTIRYTLNGETLEAAGKVTVKKFSSPIKSLKISLNGKVRTVNAKKYRYDYCYDMKGKKKTDKVKINLKPAKGWKIARIKCRTEPLSGKSKSLKIKNNKTFKIRDNYNTTVVYTLKKGKTTFEYMIYFNAFV